MLELKNGQFLSFGQKIQTWPNALSALRLLISLLLYSFIIREYLGWAFLVFLAGVATDIADGVIARKYNQITDFGKALDPLADKVFFLTASYWLIPKEFFWWWAAIFALEWELFFMGLIAFFRKDRGSFKLGANIYGKNKMVAEMVLLVELFLLKFKLIKYEPSMINVIFGVIAGFAILSIFGHIRFKKTNKP